MRFLFLLMFISFNALAIDWSDMEVDQEFTLDQSFQLPQTGRAASMMDFMKGEKFFLKEISPLPINVVLYNFEYKNCPGPSMTTDLEIIPVTGTSPLVEIGAQLQETCEMWIFVEIKDYYTHSFFK